MMPLWVIICSGDGIQDNLSHKAMAIPVGVGSSKKEQ